MGKRRQKTSKRKFLLFYSLLLIIAVLGYREWNKHSEKHIEVKLGTLPEGFQSFGIDVSHHQGEIDWDTFFEAKDSLISFVYCKATEGINHVDREWKRNRAILLKNKIANGAYHFYLPSRDPVLQAKHFLSHYSSNDNDLPPVLDIETENGSSTALIANLKLWLEFVEEKTGYRPIIYTSHHMYKTLLRDHFPSYKFWIANYNKNVIGLESSQILHWQYSENGSVPGIEKAVDLNYSKIKF